MTNTNTSGDIMEKKDKRVWSKYNPSLVNRIDILLDTSFLESWKDDLEKENDGKVGHPYEYPQEFFVFLSRMRSLWNVPFRELEGFVRKLSELTGKFRPLSYVAIFRRIRCIPISRMMDEINGAARDGMTVRYMEFDYGNFCFRISSYMQLLAQLEISFDTLLSLIINA